MKNIYFVINNDYIEYYVDGECITDCFSKDNKELIELINELHEHADVPIYQKIENLE